MQGQETTARYMLTSHQELNDTYERKVFVCSCIFVSHGVCPWLEACEWRRREGEKKVTPLLYAGKLRQVHHPVCRWSWTFSFVCLCAAWYLSHYWKGRDEIWDLGGGRRGRAREGRVGKEGFGGGRRMDLDATCRDRVSAREQGNDWQICCCRCYSFVVAPESVGGRNLAR